MSREADQRPAAKQAFSRFRQDLSFLRALQEPTPVTRTILMALGGVFFVSWLVTNVWVVPEFGEVESSMLPMILFGAKVNDQIYAGQWWRLITHTFVHADILHLVLNGYALYVLGTIAERMLGSERFIVLYSLSALGGAVATLLFNDVPSVGASGAIFGVFGGVIAFGYLHRDVLPEQVGRSLSTGLLPYLVLSLLFGLIIPMIDNAAHLGGLVTGVVVTVFLRAPFVTENESPTTRALLRGFAAAVVLAAVVAGSFAADYGKGCLGSEASWSDCSDELD